MTKDMNCAYCAEGELVDKFGIKIRDLKASKVYLFREQSHRGRVIVASKFHVSEIVDLSPRDRQAFLDDVATVIGALHRAFKPKKVNVGAYGDTGCHLHFHLVPKYEDDPFEFGDVFAMNPKRKFLTDDEYSDLVAKIAAQIMIGDGRDLRKSLVAIRDEIVRDGVVDYDESTFLLKALAQFETTSATIANFVKALREVRADRKIDQAESERIINLLDELLA